MVCFFLYPYRSLEVPFYESLGLFSPTFLGKYSWSAQSQEFSIFESKTTSDWLKQMV